MSLVLLCWTRVNEAPINRERLLRTLGLEVKLTELEPYLYRAWLRLKQLSIYPDGPVKLSALNRPLGFVE